MEISAEITRLIIDESSDQQLVFVAEKDGNRFFPIMIGVPEALALDRAINGIEPPRPMTSELIAYVISGLGCALERFVIPDIRNNVFIGTLVLKSSKGGSVKVDCRPSDGLAIATLLKVPIFVESSVFDVVCPTNE